MKNVLSEIVTKSENILPEINDEDIVIIAKVVAKIASELKEIKNTYHEPKEYVKKILTLLKYKKNIIANLIVYDFKNLDPSILYGPADLKGRIMKNMQSGMLYDNADMIATIDDEFNAINDYTSPNDISKALKALEKEIGLINIPGKENIKKIKRKQKIDFLGKPSLYKLPPHSESLKRVMSKPKVIELIFKSLISMGYLPYLEFVCEATFYAIRDQNSEETVYPLVKGASTQVEKNNTKVDKSVWEWYRNELLSKSDDQLKMLACKLAENTINDPDLSQFILLLSLSKSS